MENIYVILICKKCRKSNILLENEVEDTKRDNKYLACAHCGSKKFVVEKATNNIRDCMKERSYKRSGGALRQVE
ncbi:MAG: hypothetical protein E7I47_16330 [Clostridium sp.]|uniref:hypothetical protein n=1 Tax=Clostridium sp. TaxID=1506 RepID=UPI002908E3BB|nr:hypothetical protein [Clostridium sp.]MDU4320862.1 hypothetical protein [Clostridium sp.]